MYYSIKHNTYNFLFHFDTDTIAVQQEMKKTIQCQTFYITVYFSKFQIIQNVLKILYKLNNLITKI